MTCISLSKNSPGPRTSTGTHNTVTITFCVTLFFFHWLFWGSPWLLPLLNSVQTLYPWTLISDSRVQMLSIKTLYFKEKKTRVIIGRLLPSLFWEGSKRCVSLGSYMFLSHSLPSQDRLWPEKHGDSKITRQENLMTKITHFHVNLKIKTCKQQVKYKLVLAPFPEIVNISSWALWTFKK